MFDLEILMPADKGESENRLNKRLIKHCQEGLIKQELGEFSETNCKLTFFKNLINITLRSQVIVQHDSHIQLFLYFGHLSLSG